MRADVAMIMCTTLGWALWPVLVRCALKNSNAISVTLSIGMSGALVLPILYFFATKNNFHFTMPVAGFAWAFGAYVINMIAQLAFQRAIGTVPVGIVVAVTSCYPALTATLCYLIFGDVMTIKKIFGMILVILGLMFVAL